jgi:branched-chain amino acid transport system substrate-binding protein
MKRMHTFFQSRVFSQVGLVLLAVVLMMLALACSQPTAQVIEKPTIGVILPFSSAFTEIAQEQKYAIELALADSDMDAKLIYADCGGDKVSAKAAYDKLMTGERPDAIISCASWTAEALHPLAARDGVFHVVIGSAAFNRTIEDRTVRFTLDAREEEKQLAEYLKAFETIAIMNMDNDYGNNWAKAIKERFGEKVVSVVAYDPQAKSFKPALKQVAASKPEALVLLSAGNAARIAEEARAMGIKSQLVGTRPIERPELLKTKATEGLVYTYPSYNKRHPLVDAYEAAYEAQPTIFAMEAYDSLTTLLDAIFVAGNSPDNLFTWYAGRSYDGALGKVTFDLQGDAKYPYLYKEIIDNHFKVAPFQYAMLLEEVSEEIYHAFHEMHESVEEAEEELSRVGINDPEVQMILNNMYEQNTHAYDVAIVDSDGIIIAVAPQRFSDIIGADISKQEQIVRLHKTKEPVVSLAIDTVEGFTGFDLEHPILNEEGELVGSVSVLTVPDFFAKVISPRMLNYPVEIWIMQTDGRILYDQNEEEIGRDLFTDPIYKDFKSLIDLGKKMAKAPKGAGTYSFLSKNMDEKVVKGLVWTTVELHGTEFRIALAHVIADE